MFDFKNAKENEGRKFVGYGVNNNVTIISVESGASVNGTPFIQVNLKNTGDEDSNATIQKMYITDKSKAITMGKIMTIHSAVSKIEALKNKSFDTPEEMAEGLNSLWAGKRFRLKLQASEYLGEDQDGNPKTKIRTEIPMRNFAEAIDKGAEMYPIADADTQLTFNKDDKWDYKRLETTGQNAPVSHTFTSGETKSDLPF